MFSILIYQILKGKFYVHILAYGSIDARIKTGSWFQWMDKWSPGD
ncbi:MAG: hypothetical protein ACNYNY_06330 [Candidatus Oxydemutatoraceae bacterium WSBS_2016_MAG_OTU14]